MESQHPVSAKGSQEHVRNIPLDIILSIFTCFIYNIYVQYRQMRALNSMLNQEKYNFLTWLLLTIITCGLYHVYHEYRKSEDIARVNGKTHSNDGVVALVLTIFGLSLVTDAIQQSEINRYYGDDRL